MITFILIIFLSFVFSYLIGSIPTGFWFAKYFFNIDITENGSQNIGATNVARVLGSKKYFFLIFFLDFIKAFLCLFLMKNILIYFLHTNIENILIFNAIVLLVGNAYSVFLSFKGGKGVATTLGILLFLFPVKLFAIFICCWILILLLAKRVDLASLFSTYLITIVYWIFLFYFSDSTNYLFFLLFLCFWITFRHKENIKSFLFK